MANTVNCMNCGRTGYSSPDSYDGCPSGWLTLRNWLGGAKGFFCSNKCKDEHKSRNN
jgi:hypothetical protein